MVCSAKKKQWLTFLQENNGFLSSSVHEEVGVKVLTKGMNGLKKKKKTNTSILKNRVLQFSLSYKGLGWGKRVQLMDADKKLHQQTASSPGGTPL